MYILCDEKWMKIILLQHQFNQMCCPQHGGLNCLNDNSMQCGKKNRVCYSRLEGWLVSAADKSSRQHIEMSCRCCPIISSLLCIFFQRCVLLESRVSKSKRLLSFDEFLSKGQTISKANYGVLNNRGDKFQYIKLSQCSIFWRIEDTINCF